MKFLSDTRVHLTAEEALALAVQSLQKIGYDAEEARIIADHVVDAALCGYEYSGLPKILNVAEHRQLKEPRRSDARAFAKRRYRRCSTAATTTAW